MIIDAPEKVLRRIKGIVSPERISVVWEIGSQDNETTRALALNFSDTKIKVFKQILHGESWKPGFGGDLGENVEESDFSFAVSDFEVGHSETVERFADTDSLRENGSPDMKSPDGKHSDSSEPYWNFSFGKIRWVDKLLETKQLEAPNMLWIHSRCEQKDVLKSFGSRLSEVDVVVLELNIGKLNDGVHSVVEVLENLTNGFNWHSNPVVHYSDFQALFINKKHRYLSSRLRNRLLWQSMESRVFLGIRYSSSVFLKKIVQKGIDFIHQRLMNVLRKNESFLFSLILTQGVLRIKKRNTPESFSSKYRQILSVVQPSNPLDEIALPPIDVAIPCHYKDFDNLKLVLEGVNASVLNPIREIILITPSKYSEILRLNFPNCRVLTDDEVITEAQRAQIDAHFPNGRKSWVLQQVIKIMVALTSEVSGTLILDADTILLQKRVWLDRNGRQVLCFGEDYYLPYKKHQRRVFGGENHLMSFVTHFQLMKKDVLLEMFRPDGSGLIRWLALADANEGSSISEYDTYGEWIVTHRPKEVIFVKWNNLPHRIIPSEISYSQTVDWFGKYGSISNHSYLD